MMDTWPDKSASGQSHQTLTTSMLPQHLQCRVGKGNTLCACHPCPTRRRKRRGEGGGRCAWRLTIYFCRSAGVAAAGKRFKMSDSSSPVRDWRSRIASAACSRAVMRAAMISCSKQHQPSVSQKILAVMQRQAMLTAVLQACDILVMDHRTLVPCILSECERI